MFAKMSLCNGRELMVVILVVWPMAMEVSMAYPGLTLGKCKAVNCQEVCSRLGSSFTYRPQDCEDCCSTDEINAESGGSVHSTDKRLFALEGTVSELRVMTGVLLGLVLLLIFVVLGLLLHLSNTSVPSINFPVLFRHKKTSTTNDKLPQTHKTSNGVDSNSNGLKNVQNTGSPRSKRASVSRSPYGQPHETQVSEVPARPFRVREPSESSCPEEGEDMTHVYDNLGLSTSTIHTTTAHNTSTDSSDTLSPGLSTNTLDTTLPSVQNPSSNNTQV